MKDNMFAWNDAIQELTSKSTGSPTHSKDEWIHTGETENGMQIWIKEMRTEDENYLWIQYRNNEGQKLTNTQISFKNIRLYNELLNTWFMETGHEGGQIR